MAEKERVTELKAERERLKERIKEIDNAISETAKENLQSYEIDTGSSRRALDRVKIPDLLKAKEAFQKDLSRVEEEIKEIDLPTKRKQPIRIIYKL